MPGTMVDDDAAAAPAGTLFASGCWNLHEVSLHFPCLKNRQTIFAFSASVRGGLSLPLPSPLGGLGLAFASGLGLLLSLPLPLPPLPLPPFPLLGPLLPLRPRDLSFLEGFSTLSVPLPRFPRVFSWFRSFLGFSSSLCTPGVPGAFGV